MKTYHAAVLVACLLAVSCGSTAEQRKLVLDAGALYGGLEATRVLPKSNALVLDKRNWKPGSKGVIVTDVIDLGGSGVLTDEERPSELRVQADAGAGVSVQVRTGGAYFQAPGTWEEWTAVNGAINPKGRYAQVRIELQGDDPKSTPSVRGATLSWRLQPVKPRGALVLVSDEVRKIVRAPVEFGYEKPSQSDVAWLRRTFRLDDVIAGKKTEFEKLRALMRWVATRPNKRPGPWEAKREPYPWHIRRILTEDNGGTIYGHCMSYCEVMITAASAFGWQGRHWAIHGVRDTSHEVPEIWIDELGKWVFFDPSLDTYYADQKTGEPLNLLEMHNLYLKTVFQPGEVQRRGRHVNEDRLQKLRGKHPIRCVTGDYTYGRPAKWDWEWDHGYMSAGWMQLTPRNDWHSSPEPGFRYFGWGAEGYGGFPLYIDGQTPIPEDDASRWYTRQRDFWWTLNQASFRLVRTGEAAVAVECGNNQPFFKRYLARIGGGEWKPVEPRFTWTFQPGDNRLEVLPEDEFGKRGIASSVVVRYRR